LIASDVVVTSSHGIFDKPIAEWVLGAMLALAKDLPRTLELQRQREWRHREPELLSGTDALIVGAGGIGRATARLLAGVGVRVRCVAATARDDPEFGRLLAPHELVSALPEADWLVLAVPLRPETEGMINADALALLRPGARLVNVGRGRLVIEDAVIEALQLGRLGGAALDVFASEPLDPESPLWGMENVIVSPHMSWDVVGWRDTVVALFVENLQRRMRNEPLANVVDKATGRLQA
jgi:phosphoglycerate dehydrogenase-like enzyme